MFGFVCIFIFVQDDRDRKKRLEKDRATEQRVSDPNKWTRVKRSYFPWNKYTILLLFIQYA